MTTQIFHHSDDGYRAAVHWAIKIGGQLSRDRRGYVVDPPGTILTDQECAQRGERYFIESWS
jgi:hypothetical protein